MIGLQVILFYVLFWWFSWWISGKFLSNKKGMLRYSIFGAIAGLPFYIFLFQWSVYTYKCSNTFYFVPDGKIEKPDVLFYPGHISENSYEKNSEGDEVLNYFSGVTFKYIVSYNQKVDRKIFLNNFIENVNEYTVYPYVKSDIEEKDKIEIVKQVRYGIIRNIEWPIGFAYSTTYIYDFVKKKSISGFSSISYSRSMDSVLYFLLLFNFENCSGGKKNLFLSSSDLLVNTFKWD